MNNPTLSALRAGAFLLAVFTVPGLALALPSGQASCRDAMSKAMAGYAKTTGQVVAACNKERSAGTRPLATDCNDVDDADDDGRVGTERSRARSGILSACSGAGPLLASYASCPAPAELADDDGATTGIDDFSELADCLIALSDASINTMSDAAQGNPEDELDDNPAKCQAAMAKLAAGVIKAFAKEGRKCQRRLDGTSSSADFGCESITSSQKVTKTHNKFAAKFNKVCVLPAARLATLNACADTFDAFLECSRAAAEQTGLMLIRNVYELTGGTTTTTEEPPTTTLPPTTTTLDTSCGAGAAPTCDGDCPDGQSCQDVGGECSCIVDGAGACAPATIRRIIHAKYDTPPSQTSLSTGWSGSAHDVDIPNDVTDAMDVVCDENCQSCNISLNTRLNDPASNCRCSSDSTKNCSVINGNDPDHCSGLDQQCRCYFGSPLAISAGGTPVCVVNEITDDYEGSMNLRTGEWDVRIKLAAVVHLGIDSVSPCPTCEGDITFNDGVRDGNCAGGLTSAACDVNGEHMTFGPTSFDCLPNAATNISGSGLLLDLKTSSDPQSLASNLPCDEPVGGQCPCAVCSGNSSVGCSSDADCAEQDAGTCTAGGGAGIKPNECTNFACGASGRCTIGPVDKYCDGTTHPDGRGFISCTTDVDCSANGQGACKVIDLRRCYTDPILADGSADTYTPVTSAIFCIPPTTSPAVNLTGGIPGPGVITLDFDSDIRCKSDPSLVYEFPNGANCGVVTTTTSTTLLPPVDCEAATSPVCGGTCDGGQVCTDSAGVCECTDPPIPVCTNAVSPVCGGTCPEGQVCTDNAGTCGCMALPLPACSEAASPVCGGVCPIGQVCLDSAGTCTCTGI